MASKNTSQIILRAFFLLLFIFVEVLRCDDFVQSSSSGESLLSSQSDKSPMDNSNNGDQENYQMGFGRTCVVVHEANDKSQPPSGMLCYFQISQSSSSSLNSQEENFETKFLNSKQQLLERLRRAPEWSTRLKRPPMPFRIGGGLRSHSNRRIIITH